MPAAARGDGRDTVFSKTGAKRKCRAPMMTATDECSTDTFINTYGAVRIDDVIQLHPASGCGPDRSVLTKASTTVFINNKGAGRIGDEYTSDNIITSGSQTVFIGG